MKWHLPGSRISLLVALLAGLSPLPGCGPGGGTASGSVSGTVTCNGKPVTRGSVLFVKGDKGIGVSSPLDQSGGYHIPALQTGQYLVAIQPPAAPPPEAIEKGGKVETLPIPKKYLVLETSGLSTTVKEGQNTLDFNL